MTGASGVPLGLGLLAFACGYPEVSHVASQDMKCPEADIDTQWSDENFNETKTPAILARGCGHHDYYVKLCPKGVGDTGECFYRGAAQLRKEVLLTRAAFDLQCAKTQISTVELDERASGVNGCGQRATYVWTCPHSPKYFSAKCTYVLNSDALPLKR